MTVKLHISETQDDRECHHVNYTILGDLFIVDKNTLFGDVSHNVSNGIQLAE